MLLNLTHWAFNGVIFSINAGCLHSCKIYKKKKKWNKTLKAKTKADPLATGGIFVVAMASPSRGAFFFPPSFKRCELVMVYAHLCTGFVVVP